MRNVEIGYVFDLERVIKKSNNNYITKKGEQEYAEANYIIDSFAKEISIDAKKIKNAIIKTAETYNIKTKNMNEPKSKRRRIIKYYIMSEKEKLEIIKQITVITKTQGLKEVFRDIKIFEKEDLIRLGYLTIEGTLNPGHPIVKKLVLNKNR